jgi:excinuclease UvrABC ATPase subunit
MGIVIASPCEWETAKDGRDGHRDSGRAREHDLRDVSLVLPRGKLICLTGVSGSGKSSLAFDTLYAEGQRRYVESLSSYARQFLGRGCSPGHQGTRLE